MRSWNVAMVMLSFGATAHAQPVVPRARIVEDLRLDAAANDFPRVGPLFIGPRGEIVVPIQADAQLQIFDSTGKHLATVGRKGAGPGEFMFVTSVGWKGDTMWVDDPRQRRVTFVSPEFKILRTIAHPTGIPMESGGSSKLGIVSRTVDVLGRRAFYTDGSVVGEYTAMPTDNRTQGAWGGDHLVVRLSAAGVGRVIATLPWDGDARWAMSSDGFGERIPFTLSPTLVASETGDRFAYMTCDILSKMGGTFTVTMFKPTGDTVFVRTLPFAGVPVTQSDRDSALATFLPRPGRPREGPSELGQRFQAIAKRMMPPSYAGVESLLLGIDNTVWISLRPNVLGQPVLVLNGIGIPIASIILPKNSRLRQASATRVWLTQTDDDGLSSVVRYRVHGVSCGTIRC